jgi:insertion element IS1 protein InsB
VLKVIRQEAAAVPEPAVPRHIRTLELDEFWSFAGSKKQPRWTWYAWDREHHQVVAFVNGRRTDEMGRALRRKLGQARVNTYRTDRWPTYARCLPRRRQQTGKGGTCHIERNHLNFRTRVKRLQRRTICYSRSEEMHDAVIKLFIHYSSPRAICGCMYGKLQAR